MAASLGLLAAGAARAQLPIPGSTQFDVTGFIEEATLGPGTSGLNVGPGTGAHQGGIIKVNGHVIIVPSETIVIFPANALTWQEVFAQAPAPYTGVATGMAMADLPVPLTTYEAHVLGNRVLPDANHPADAYIAGLIYVSQHALNNGQGFINFIDYATGEFRVGGILGSSTTGTRVRLNDPLTSSAVGASGRYSLGQTPDRRFMVDQDNPTIMAATGYPMCIPRVAPPASDALCPQSQRPAAAVGFATTIQTNDPRPVCTNPPTNTIPAGCSPTGTGGTVPPTPLAQVPMEVGDWVSFAGTLVTDNALQPTVGPVPTSCAAGTGPAACTYVSAHTVTNNVAVFTWPGTNPAYIMTDVTLIGTGGLTIIGAAEAVVRTRFEGMMTDPSRSVHLYGIDLNPVTGATSDRDWGTIGVDPGPPNGAVKGRWRFRPPCAPFGTVVAKPDKQCVANPSGTFLPPTREMRSVIEGLQSQNPANPAALTAANGLFYGQYHAPISDYIFPENIPGAPIVENNFNALDFLALGGYTSAGNATLGIPGTLVGVLNPWPSNVLPTAACTPPTAANTSAGGPYTVAFGKTVPLSAASGGTAPVTFTWTVPAAGTITPLNLATVTYDATGAAAGQVVTVTVTATNNCGSASASSTVTVATPTAPTVNPVAPVTVFSGQAGSIALSGSDPNVPALLPLTFTVAQTGLLNPLVTRTSPTTASFTFTAPTLAVGVVTPTVITLTIGATNSAGVAANPVTSTVTVQPLPDAVTIATAVYRLGQQRLAITANSTVVSPNVVLTLQPYATQAGGTFTPPNGQLTNNGNGLYSITLVGAPEPFCGPGRAGTITPPACTGTPLVVRSNLNGVSPNSALTTVRQ